MKDRKFKTAVSMKVTQEQYEKDLKKPLEELGYGLCEDSSPSESNHILQAFQNNNSEMDLILMFLCFDGDTYFIDHYNPDLFLSLAAMTEGEEPIVGEYYYRIKDNFVGSKIGQVMKLTGGTPMKQYWRKATKEELIKHFSKEESIAKPYKVEDLVKDVSKVKSFEYDGESTYTVVFGKDEKSVEEKLEFILGYRMGGSERVRNETIKHILETFDIKFK